MNLRLLVITTVLLVAGLSALLGLQWKLGLGEFVSSPQQVVVPLGSRKIVGGGRAGVELTNRRGERAEVVVRCAERERWLTLAPGKVSDEVCSIRLKLTGFSSATGTLATSEAHLEITWSAEAEEPSSS